jgi:hypothetical protein
MIMTSLMIFLHLIPTTIFLMICLMTIFLMILPSLPERVAMILLTVWLALRLKSNAEAEQRRKHDSLHPARQR